MDKFEKKMWLERNPVRLARMKKDITRKDLAPLVDMSIKGLYLIEHGISVPRKQTLMDIAELLKTDYADLYAASTIWFSEKEVE